jgi:MFS family permease
VVARPGHHFFIEQVIVIGFGRHSAHNPAAKRKPLPRLNQFNMKKALAPVAALLIGVAILLTGQGLQGTLLPVRANLEHFSTVGVGVIGATYFLGFTLGCLLGASMIHRVGHVRVFAAMTAAASASPLMHGLWINIWSWAVLRMVTGFCFAVLYMVIESWINEKSSNENRGAVFSAYSLINMTVLAFGQQMLLLDDPMQMSLFALASVLVSLAAVPVVLSTSDTLGDVQDVKLDIPYLYRISPAGMLGALATGLANGSFWALAPIFTADFSDDIRLAAWFMSSAVVGGALGQWPLGYLSDHIDRRYVMALTALGSLVVAGAIWFFSDNLSTIKIVSLGSLWGAMAFPLYAIAVAQANDYAQKGEHVMVSSGLLFMYGIGAVAGPLAASAAMSLAGASGLFVFTGFIHFILLIYILNRTLRQVRPRAGQHLPFDDSLAAATTTSLVYEKEID